MRTKVEGYVLCRTRVDVDGDTHAILRLELGTDLRVTRLPEEVNEVGWRMLEWPSGQLWREKTVRVRGGEAHLRRFPSGVYHLILKVGVERRIAEIDLIAEEGMTVRWDSMEFAPE